MSYVGNTNTTQAFAPAIDYFSGNGSTVAFTLSRPVASVAQVQVVVNNVAQNPTDAYTVLNNTITFTGAPSSGTNNIYVYYTSPITQVAALPQNPQVFGNLQFSSSGARITGDMSNATLANRVAFQTSTTNGSTTIMALPNGTGSNSQLLLRSSSAATDDSFGQVVLVGGTEFRISSGASGTGTSLPMTFFTGGSERMRVDTSGNVGIGTSSPSSRLHVAGGAGSTIRNTASAGSSWFVGSNVDSYILHNESNTPMIFTTNASERARIDTSGNLCVGTTTAGISNSIGTTIESSGLDAARITVNHSSGGSSNGSFFMRFAYAGTQSGSISQSSTTSVAFNTSSDRRLKTDNGLAVDTSVIDNTEIHDFTWISSGDADRGVFAQDAILVKPSAVTVGSDEVNDDGSIITPWSVDYSKYVPDLIVHAQQLKKQVQEQQAIITALTARVEALENK